MERLRCWFRAKPTRGTTVNSSVIQISTGMILRFNFVLPFTLLLTVDASGRLQFWFLNYKGPISECVWRVIGHRRLNRNS